MSALASTWDIRLVGGEASGMLPEPLPVEDDPAIVRVPREDQDITVLPARLRRQAGMGQEDRIVAAWEASVTPYESAKNARSVARTVLAAVPASSR